MTGHYLHLVAARDAILSTARMSPAARARAMGRTYYQPVAAVVPAVVEPAPPLPKKRLGLGPRSTAIGRAKQVVAAFAKAFEVDVDAILSPRRSRKVARPRQAAMYFLHVEMEMTTTPLGKLMGRDHSTVLHAKRVVSALLITDDEFSQRYHRAVRALRAIWSSP